MDSLSFAGLLSTLYDSACAQCKRAPKKALVEVKAALPLMGLAKDKREALFCAVTDLESAQLASERAVGYLQAYYGIKSKVKNSGLKQVRGGG